MSVQDKLKELVVEVIKHLNKLTNSRHNVDQVRTKEAIKILVDEGYTLLNIKLVNEYYAEKFKSDKKKTHPDKIYVIKMFEDIPDDYVDAKLAEYEKIRLKEEEAAMQAEIRRVAQENAPITTATAIATQTESQAYKSIVIPSVAEINKLGIKTIIQQREVSTAVGKSESGIENIEITDGVYKGKHTQPILIKEEAFELCRIVKEQMSTVPKWRPFPRKPGYMSTIVNGRRFMVRNEIYQELPKAL